MNSRFSVIIRVFLVACAAFALLFVALKQSRAAQHQVSGGEQMALTGRDGGGPGIQATERISIPFGFDAGLAMMDDGAAVVASGVGGCTDGESITIVFSVTQAASSATVTGLWNGQCSGQLQTWTKAATATPSPNFAVGPAEACAFAETRDGENSVTDTQEWCDDVILTSPAAYLPAILKP